MTAYCCPVYIDARCVLRHHAHLRHKRNCVRVRRRADPPTLSLFIDGAEWVCAGIRCRVVDADSDGVCEPRIPQRRPAQVGDPPHVLDVAAAEEEVAAISPTPAAPSPPRNRHTFA